jgi:hypothetical protein
MWNWRHTPEAYKNAHRNLEIQSRAWLCEVIAEWPVYRAKRIMASEIIKRADILISSALSKDSLIDIVWQEMSNEEDGRLCSNGG